MGDIGKYTFTVDHSQEKTDKKNYNLTPSESVFFMQMEKSLKKYAGDMSAPKPLETLYENIHRLNRLFVSLGRPWLKDSGIIQKASAWYIAYAKPTKVEARKLIETLNGFTAATGYLAEWNVLVNRMQEFFSVQEKELKHLFEYEKETERNHKARMERLRMEGETYCMCIGEGEVYGLLYSQIEELYKLMERFLEREKAPFQYKSRCDDEYSISISKDICLYADKEDFHVSYSLDTFDSELNCMSAKQMQRVVDTILDFLNVFGENGEKKVRWDIVDCPDVWQPDITFEIKEDSRLSTFRTAPWISKRINKKEDEEPKEEYFIDVNEIPSTGLSFNEFVAVYSKLGDFLNGYPRG